MRPGCPAASRSYHHPVSPAAFGVSPKGSLPTNPKSGARQGGKNPTGGETSGRHSGRKHWASTERRAVGIYRSILDMQQHKNPGSTQAVDKAAPCTTAKVLGRCNSVCMLVRWLLGQIFAGTQLSCCPRSAPRYCSHSLHCGKPRSLWPLYKQVWKEDFELLLVLCPWHFLNLVTMTKKHSTESIFQCPVPCCSHSDSLRKDSLHFGFKGH